MSDKFPTFENQIVKVRLTHNNQVREFYTLRKVFKNNQRNHYFIEQEKVRYTVYPFKEDCSNATFIFATHNDPKLEKIARDFIVYEEDD